MVRPAWRILGHSVRLSLSKAFLEEMNSPRFLVIPFHSYREIKGKLCICEVYQRDSRWFASIVVDLPELPLKQDGKILAIDLGVYNLAACVDETGQGILYSGRGLLAIQHYFNKQIAETDGLLGLQCHTMYCRRTKQLAFFLASLQCTTIPSSSTIWIFL